MRQFLHAPIGASVFIIEFDPYSPMCCGCHFPFWLWFVSGFLDQSAYFCNWRGIVDAALCFFYGDLGNLSDYVVRMYLTRFEHFVKVC